MGYLVMSLLAMPASVLAQSPQAGSNQPESNQTVSYQCDNSKRFSVEYGQATAQLRLDSVNVISLPQVVSGSGIRYSNGSTTLYSQGNQAFIEEGGQRTYSNCVSQTPSATEPITSRAIVYQCANNASFTARYRPQSAEVMLEGTPTVTLPQVPSASGARYSNGEITLFTKGSEAFVERGTTVYENCVAQTPAPTAPEPIHGMW